MRKLILYTFAVALLALLTHSAHAQYGYFNGSSHNRITWGYYNITGSLAVDGQNSSVNDSTAYAPYNASFRAGFKGLNKGTIINTPENYLSIPSPVMGMIVCDTTLKQFFGYNGTNWLRLDSLGDGSFDTAAIYYQLGLRVKYSDTGSMLAPYVRKGDSGVIFETPYHAATTYQPIGSYLTSESDPLSPHLSDSTVKYVTPAQLAGFNYLTSYSETDPIFTASDAFPITSTNISNWTAAYNDKVNSLAFSGTTTKTLTLTQQDGGTVSNTFTDENTIYTAQYPITLSSTTFGIDTSTATGVATKYDVSQAGGGPNPLDSTLADGNTGHNKNIVIDRTSGTYGFHLLNGGFDYAHLEITAAGTQLHQFDGDRESILTEDGLNIIDNATGKSISIQPNYIKGDTIKLNSGLAVNSLVSGATADRVNVMPNASGQIALTTDIPIMAGGSATFVGDDVTTTFTIAHGLGTTPTFSGVWFNNLAANTRRCYWTSADATNVTFTCGTPPINLEQIKMGWIAVKNP